MKQGDSATVTRTFTAADQADYLALGGGGMPAGEAGEPLVGALFSYLLGVRLPGPGTNYLKQQTRFLAPIPLDVPLTARVTITRLRPEKHLVDLETMCEAGGVRIAEGRALVYVEDVAGRPW